jgi:flagellar basal-body rod protein FlgC
MSLAINTAFSGLEAASKRIEVSAANIANQDSVATRVNGVTTNKSYIPQDVVQISLGAGGVRTEVRNSDTTAPTTDITNNQPPAHAVDTEKQLIDQQVASYDFKANLKSIKTAASLEQNLLDILS